MKKNYFPLIIAGVFLACTLGGCSKAVTLVNTLTFDSSIIAELQADYDADDITVLKGAAGEIIIKEYMSEDKRAYYAKTRCKEGKLFITEGRRPLSKSFVSRIEIYLPDDYIGTLDLHTTSGKIKSDFDFHFDAFKANTTSGSIEVANLYALKLDLVTTSGSIQAEALTAETVTLISTSGHLALSDIQARSVNITTTSANTALNDAVADISYTTTSGSLELKDITGAARLNAQGDGDITAHFTAVTGDVSIHNKNGGISLFLPEMLAFQFVAETRNGTVTTNFDEALSRNGSNISGVIGTAPHITITLSTRNGRIDVMQ